MKPEETAAVKKALQYIKIARYTDYATFNMMMASENFNEEIIKNLERISGWNEENERNTETLAKKFLEETKGRTLSEKSKNLTRILSISGGIAAAIAAAGGITYAIRQSQKKRGKKNADAEK